MSKVPRVFLSKGAFAMYKPAQSALLDADKAVRIVTLSVASTKYIFNFPVLNLMKLV